jgi:hypothetical protein
MQIKKYLKALNDDKDEVETVLRKPVKLLENKHLNP